MTATLGAPLHLNVCASVVAVVGCIRSMHFICHLLRSPFSLSRPEFMQTNGQKMTEKLSFDYFFSLCRFVRVLRLCASVAVNGNEAIVANGFRTHTRTQSALASFSFVDSI